MFGRKKAPVISPTLEAEAQAVIHSLQRESRHAYAEVVATLLAMAQGKR